MGLNGKDGDDMVMTDGRRRLCFAQESFHGHGTCRRLRHEHFDGHDPIQLRIIGLEHHSHPATTNHFDDFVGAEFADSPRCFAWFQKRKVVIVRRCGRI